MPEVFTFSLFYTKLLTLEQRKPNLYKLEKPTFPIVDDKTELVDLITPKSFKFFSILKLDHSWRAMNPGKLVQ